MAACAGAKNAALPIMAASILAEDTVWLEGVPELADVETLSLVLRHLGVEVQRKPDGRLKIDTVDSAPTRADGALVRRMRASFCVLGPLLARRGRAVVALPGGCNIGHRPVDLHLAGLAALGAVVRIEQGYVVAAADKLSGAVVHLAGPRGPTVTGTANVLCAAARARGSTLITGAAAEPEIVDLGRFLIGLGARIDGLGSTTIEVTGVEGLAGTSHRIIPDRIEAATLLVAAAITGGSVTVTGVVPRHLEAVLACLVEMGSTVSRGADWVRLVAPARPRPANVSARPYPGVPSDVQAQLMALAALAQGRSVIRDWVFGDRFGHVAQLQRLGARIERRGPTAVVTGVPQLSGAAVVASDLRASAALVLAGLAAGGVTSVRRIHHLDRGYERLELKLAALGARIERTNDPAPCGPGAPEADDARRLALAADAAA